MRDLGDIQKSNLPVFAIGVTPLGPYREGPGEINVPIVCGGQVVMPGDILVGDEDGIVVIPRRDAAELLEAARANLNAEQDEMERMRAGSYTQREHLERFTGAFRERGGSFCKRPAGDR